MIGSAIRKLGSWVYAFPQLTEDVAQPGRYGQLKIALVTDYFTADCLSAECRVRVMTPSNFRTVLDEWQPDLVFVESTFHGVSGEWRYELARQSKLMRLSQPKAIFHLIEYAKNKGIPTVFWNKDDGAFFEAFIDVAKAFDFVFTTDQACILRYRQQLPAHVPVDTLAMPYQPAFHQFTGFNFTRNEVCFTGSYYRRILNERRRFLDMVFDTCAAADVWLNVFDRNHHRLSRHFEFRFPKSTRLRLHSSVAHRDTAQVYKTHTMSLNVNSVTDSDTMCSRRLLEILACGGIAVTNPGLAVEKHFGDFCHVIRNHAEALELFSRLRHGPSPIDLERAAAGAAYVKQHHTWSHRLEQICAAVNI
ncbi:CgeB family protein [Leeia oryzae]|uniref:CgeB family protein n=1 Tax=Leeia oryzae TaxID=356662 RepID=UPI0003728017|nr:glycosyltransferase [Leeia oryzae]